jgi:hypothetical protein
MLVKQFENYEIRHIYKDNQFYYLANDILAALEYKDPRVTWAKAKPFIEATLGDVSTEATTGSDGKQYKMSYLNLEQVFLLLQKSEQPKAIPFQIFMAKLAADYMKRAASKVEALEGDANNWQKFNELKLTGVLANPRMEVDLARRLHSWMCLCGFTNVHIEHPILNILNREQRRFDFYRSTAKTVEAYELKKNPITVEDVIDAICKRGYFEILKLQAIPNKRAKLTFISPHKINLEVQRLSDTSNNQLVVTTLKELSEDYYFKARKRKWKHQITHLDRIKLDPYYTCLFNEL